MLSQLRTTTKTASATITLKEKGEIICSSADAQIYTLPDVYGGLWYTFNNIGAGVVTVKYGETTLAELEQNQHARIINDSTNWIATKSISVGAIPDEIIDFIGSPFAKVIRLQGVLQGLNTARYALGGAGNQASALAFGGYGSEILNSTEKFNNDLWYNSSNMNVARTFVGGFGTQDAGLAAGGYDEGNDTRLASCEKFNGRLWSIGANVNLAVEGPATIGLQNAGLKFGGRDNENYYNTTEKLNSVWAASANLNASKALLAGAGLQDAAIAFGGIDGTGSYTVSEMFNGTVWTAGANMNTNRHNLAGCGVQGAALAFGGNQNNSGSCDVTEIFNGTSWSISGDLMTPRESLAGCGTQAAGLSFGGYTDSPSTTTEKFETSEWSNTGLNGMNVPSLDNNNELPLEYTPLLNGNILTSKCHMTMNSSRGGLAGCGTQDNALAFGSFDTTNATVEKYFGGTIWAMTGSMSAGRFELAGCGVQGAALAFGGNTGEAYTALTEKFDGSVWSTTGDLNTIRGKLAGAGLQDAGLSVCGLNDGGTGINVTELFNGTVWSAGANVNNSRFSPAGCGLQNAAIIVGGTNAGETVNAGVSTEKFDGSVWSVSGDKTTGACKLAAAGISSLAIAFGGCNPANGGAEKDAYSASEKFNGSAWSNISSLNTAKCDLAGAGGSTAGLSFGGADINGTGAAYSNITEKFNGFEWTDYKSLRVLLDEIKQSGSISESAAKLSTPRSITLAGQISGSALFDGSADIVIDAEVDAASTFAELTDTPAAYTNSGGKLVAVKEDASGLEYVSAAPKKYSANIGDGTNSVYNINHALGTEDILVSIINIATKKNTIPDFTIVDTNNITIDFEAVITTDSYRITVM